MSSDIECHFKLELPPSARKRRKITDFSLCILCQERKKCPLVSPKSYKNILECIRKRAEWNDIKYINISLRLEEFTPEDLVIEKASWHSDCYKICTHKANMKRSEKLYKEQLSKPKPSTSINVEQKDKERSYSTRSKIPIYDKKKCFFCDEEGKRKNQLHLIATDIAGIRLRRAVELSGKDILKIRLSDCTKPGDPYAREIAYHKVCWNTHVLNVLRLKSSASEVTQSNSPSYEATNAELLSSLSDFLLGGNITTISEIEKLYLKIAANNRLEERYIKSRKQIKTYIEEELECIGIHFSNSKRINEPQRVSLKVTADVALSQAEEQFEDIGKNMRTLLEAARILRKAVLKCENWKFTGSFEEVNVADIIPEEIVLFYKWCCQGRTDIKQTSELRDATLTNRAHKLSQMFMYEMLSPRQVLKSNTSTIRYTRELPLQVAVGLTMHTFTRSKFIIQFLHSIGISIDYAKVLRLETQLATEVVKRMDECGGFYIPSELVRGRFVYCAADNIDFLEDTPYGKGTLHGTVMVVYQEKEESDVVSPFEITGPLSFRSLQRIPQSLSEIIPCNIPKGFRPQNPVRSQINDYTEGNKCVVTSNRYEDLLWMMLEVVSLKNFPETFNEELVDTCSNRGAKSKNNSHEIEPKALNAVPNWSAYNSIISKSSKETRICVLPLIDSSPTSTQTQLTFMKKLEQVTSAITPEAKTVVTLDLGLYKPVLKLAMAKKDMSQKWILRPGELHIIMAMLRAIGSFLDGTGIETTLTVLYDENVVSKILAGKCVRRAINAHTSVRLALFKCIVDEFYKDHIEIKEKIDPELRKLLQTLQAENSQEVKSIHRDTVTLLKKLNVLSKIEEFELKEAKKKPTLRVALQYMRMVDIMLLFIRSVRTANWELHLASLEEFVKYFFALDLINYAAMIAWYLEDMQQTKIKHPDLWNELSKGKWVVSKTNVPFCTLGADEALEQENRAMKVLGGIVNITQKRQALTRFFLASPQLSRLSIEAKKMFGITDHKRSKHHHLTACRAKRQKEDTQQIYNAIMTLSNPVTYDGQQLINISTKAVFNDNIEKDTSRMTDKGCQMYNTFKEERIKTNRCSLWAPMKKENLKLCKSARKVVKTKISDTIVQLKADRSLFTRLLIVSRSRTDIDLEECLSTYELSAVPLAIFNLDGTMILPSNKSNLMKILEEQIQSTSTNMYDVPTFVTEERLSSVEEALYSAAVLDGMAELQALHKPLDVKTCSDLAIEFNKKIEPYLVKYDETHLVFDTYLENSLKNSMRRKRAGKATPVEYKITDSTNIGKLTMRALLSHSKTKDELTSYLANKAIIYAQKIKKSLVVSWRNEARSSNGNDVEELQSTHEEADTKIILHCLYISRRASTLHIFSPDTDVFVLSLWWSQFFPLNSMFVTGVGNNRRFIELHRVCSCLGSTKVKALLGLHALSGCDVTGCFRNKGKLSFWKVFKTLGQQTLDSLGKLGCPEVFQTQDEKQIERILCQVYSPGTKISDIGQLRWWLFTKKEIQSENLPPARSSLIPYILRVHYQVMEWRRADQQHPNLPEPTQFGWEEVENSFYPIMSMLPCAPEAIIQLIRCGCDKGRCAVNCKCQINSLKCTELCKCGGDEEICDNNDFEDDVNGITDSEDDQ